MQSYQITSHFVGLSLDTNTISSYFDMIDHLLRDLIGGESYTMRASSTPHITLQYLPKNLEQNYLTRLKTYLSEPRAFGYLSDPYIDAFVSHDQHTLYLYAGYRASSAIHDMRDELISLDPFDSVSDNHLTFIPHITFADIQITRGSLPSSRLCDTLTTHLSLSPTLIPTGLHLYRVSSLRSPEVQEIVHI